MAGPRGSNFAVKARQNLKFTVHETLTSWRKMTKIQFMKSNHINAVQWKSLREKAGLTQREVSDSLGYSTPQFISNVERGRCRFPIQKLSRIKKLYRMSTDQMIDLVLTEEKLLLRKVFKK